MQTAFSIDPDQGLEARDELRLVRLAADLGYASAWTPARADATAFDRCLRWHDASGLPVGISAVPASGQPPSFYAEHARRVWEGTDGRFVLALGSGRLAPAVERTRAYLAELRLQLPPGLPLYLAALGPLMLRHAGEAADGVALNWSTADHVAWSRDRVAEGAARVGRPVPPLVEYIRTAVDPDAGRAASALAAAVSRYAFAPPAYRRHFERMGFAGDVRRAEEARNAAEAGAGRAEPGPRASGGAWDARFLSAVGAFGVPGSVRPQVQRLAAGLDLPIVRVLVSSRGDAESARAVLEECAPARG